jgi:transcriptional regulator with XRE-family HTH domain
MPEGFGARLRRQREAQGIALPTIAGHTKIKQSLLEALERDDVSQWPSGIFRRAYVRSYAQAIGLDPDAVAAEFVRVHPDPAEEVTTDALAAALDDARGKAAPPTRLRYIVGSALGTLTRFGRASAPARQIERQDAGSHALPPGLEPDLPLAVDPTPQPAPFTAAEAIAEPLPHEISVDVPIRADQEDASGHTPAAAVAEWPEDLGWREEPDVAQEIETRTGDDAAERVELIEPGRSFAAPPAIEDASDDMTPVVAAEETASAVGAVPIGNVPAVPAPADPDLATLAALCTELGRAGSAEAVQRSLQQAASVLEARGLIVWLWDRWADGLRPAIAHGYSDAVLAQLPIVGRDADNVTAAAFRSARPCATGGGADASGALVVPLLTVGGCAGVLAIELEGGRALMGSVRAAATILAAQLATLAGEPSHGAPAAEDERELAMHGAVPSR